MKVVFLARRLEDGDEISEYVKSLAEHLVENGHGAAIIAFDDGAYFTIDERVEVVETELYYEGDSLYSWSMMLNNEMKEKARELLEGKGFDLIHANDWMTVPGATAMKEYLDRPMILTVHSTENERGFSDPNSPMISEMEYKGSQKADHVLVNSETTYKSTVHDLDVNSDKISVEDPLKDKWQESVLKIYGKHVKIEETTSKR